MKKKLLTLLTICLLPVAMQAGSGDVNGDGKVDEVDVTELKNFIIGKPSLGFNEENADMNQDGSIDATDIVFLIEYINERAALMDLYHATGGEHWTNHTNWGSYKPLSEWYGCFNVENQVFVKWLSLENNNLSGEIPESISGLSHLRSLNLSCNQLTGEIPSSIGEIKSLESLGLTENALTGTIPKSVCELPLLKDLNLKENKLSGSFPAYLTQVMDRVSDFCYLDLRANYFTGKIPDEIVNHPRFKDMWTIFLSQYTDLDVSDLVLYAPDFELVDLDGNTIRSNELYKNNKLTLLYSWESWCPYSLSFNEKLIPAYHQFHEKGFEVLGFSTLCYHALPCVDEDTYRDYLNEKSVPWHNIAQNSSINNYIPLLYHCVSPTTILVDQDGRIVSESLSKGGEDYSKIIPRLEEFFGEEVKGDYYTSTDYSHDGEVIKMQSATEGKGVDLVFLGEAFTDKDMASGGAYEKKMQAAMEQFFSQEPYTSLRHRFNVYMVKVVSPNEEFASDALHAINEDDDIAFDYAMKAVGEDPDNIMVGVVYNTKYFSDRSYCTMYFGDGSCVAYIMEDINEVLNHELGGHGVAQLLDEYVEWGYESLLLPDYEKEFFEEMWQKYGSGANVDWYSDPTEVKWAKFISDPRYAGEQIGVYEGAFLYGHGAYRSTLNSMMRYNDCGFNAPSRESIYKHVMTYSEGESWNYDYETFVSFDAPGREAFSKARAKARQTDDKTQQKRIESRPPVIYKGTWRDAGKYEKVKYDK